MRSARVCMWMCLTVVPAAAFGQGRQAPPTPLNPADVAREAERFYTLNLNGTPFATDVKNTLASQSSTM